MKYICELCSRNFDASPSANPRYCGRDCYNKSREGRFNCTKCNKEFTYYKSHKKGDNVFCSRECHFAYINSDVTHHPRWKGGRSVGQSGHIFLHKPDHPFANNGKVPEHRLVMEKYLNRYLRTDEVVHHLNHVKSDNRIENLVILDRASHAKIHTSRGNKWARLFDSCIQCGTIEVHHEIHGLCYNCYKVSIRKTPLTV